MFTKIAINNRGEVAVRIILACQELGIKTLLLHSDVDVKTKAYRLADETYCLGPAPTAESYLNQEEVLKACKEMGAEAVHPGFGFLSENADFAQLCEKNKIKFIGPSSSAMRSFGDKASAKKIARELKVSTLTSYEGSSQDLDSLKKEAKKIGYPIMIKATAGGGGRGLKIVKSEAEFSEILESAQREAKSSFGSGSVFLEKYLGSAKHIEVQVFGDGKGNGLYLYLRDCSVQRRHQKIIEEAGEVYIPDAVKEKLYKDAVNLVKHCNYEGAGTVEFLVEGNEYYFLEMNTRLQVEHPVTEEVLNIDLVKGQITTAATQKMPWIQESLKPSGHAIEVRVYAEDSYNKGMPATGKLGFCYWPQGPGRRFEIGFEEGDVITANYDSMIAKVIVMAETRAQAIKKLEIVLSQTVIFGLSTNIPLVREIMNHKNFIDGSMVTTFFEKNFSEGLVKKEHSEDIKNIISQLKLNVVGEAVGSGDGIMSPWQSGAWK